MHLCARRIRRPASLRTYVANVIISFTALMPLMLHNNILFLLNQQFTMHNAELSF